MPKVNMHEAKTNPSVMANEVRITVRYQRTLRATVVC